MPVLSNPKHELFAQELAKGTSQDQAYQGVGYKADPGHASRLANAGKIKARVAELLAQVNRRVEDAVACAVVGTAITIEKLTEMYLADRAEGYRTRQLAVAKSAVDSLAKLHGLWIEKSERTNINATRDDAELEAELQRVRSRVAELGASRNRHIN